MNLFMSICVRAHVPPSEGASGCFICHHKDRNKRLHWLQTGARQDTLGMLCHKTVLVFYESADFTCHLSMNLQIWSQTQCFESWNPGGVLDKIKIN